MPRIVKYGKVRGVRFKKDTDKWLVEFAEKHKKTLSEIIQAGVKCIRLRSACKARKQLLSEK